MFYLSGVKDMKKVSMHRSLAEMGMDSMMAVEIKQVLEREYDVFLTAQDIRGLTFNRLVQVNRIYCTCYKFGKLLSPLLVAI